ncbi:MAG: AAA family ATPase [Bacteroidetes bacterium]|nr:AAA family ATPase [Bacteroidota bacterium]
MVARHRKTYHTINYALSIIEKKSLNDLLKEDRAELKIRYDKYINEDRIVFTTFHQSMSYEDFIEGIKPIEPLEEGGNISYKVVDGIFKQICKKAVVRNNDVFKVLDKFKSEIYEDEGKDPITIKSPTTTFDVIYKYGNVFHVSPLNTSKKEKPWYSVSIDNIISYYNTGILTGTNQTYTREITDYLIKNKNLNKSDIAIVDISNVPNYVIIIDEINRGNVSAIFGELITLIEESKRQGKAETLEILLPYSKEKFSVPKNVYIIGTMNTADRSVEALDTALRRRFQFIEMPPNYELEKLQNILIENISLSSLLKTINERIEYLLNRDHTIGHSYFLDISSVGDLKISFFKNIIPLLQEYFYGDYAKMSLVIGQGFFEKKKSLKDITWSITDNNIEKPEREVWNLKTTMADDEFIDAIKLLIGKNYDKK